MTEPAAGSDLKGIQSTAHRDGEGWVLSGSKTFITTATTPISSSPRRRLPTRAGSASSRSKLRWTASAAATSSPSSLGQHEADTAELFFDEVRIPAENLIGEAGRGMSQMMAHLAQERISTAAVNVAHDMARVYVDRCVEAHVAGELTAVEASKAKLINSEIQSRVIDACLQLHGGYGYIEEYEVARSFVDARITRIWAGTNEIMKEVIARSLGLEEPRG
jgi:alkylation response protein AidB-like acyl-CoA dehydrogenase